VARCGSTESIQHNAMTTLQVERKRAKVKAEARSKDKKLCIFRNNFPLTKKEIEQILKGITDEDVALLATTRPAELRGICVSGYHVGVGTCLAKKLGRHGVEKSNVCVDCKHQEVLNQLNYILRLKYGERYRAGWVQKRKSRNIE